MTDDHSLLPPSPSVEAQGIGRHLPITDMMVLIEPMIPALPRYARALLRDRSLADDLVQDCLERAITRWHQRRPDGDARTWVFTILHNLAINQQRRTTRRGPHVPIEDASD